jgi:hypothetical protein
VLSFDLETKAGIPLGGFLAITNVKYGNDFFSH